MNTYEFLREQQEEVVGAAAEALARARVRHYQSAGEAEVHSRLETLFARLLEALASRDLGPIVAYAQTVAEERFNAGYDLSEVQAAFNTLEEAIWTRLVDAYPPEQLAEALGLVSTILGAGKDALAHRYVSLATRAHAPSLDMRALFTGADGP